MLDSPRALMSGIPTVIGEAVNVTGTDQVRGFSIIKNLMSSGRVDFHTSGAFTVFNGSVEVSHDNTNWKTFASFDFVAIPVLQLTLASGLQYRFNVLNITQTTPPNIYATAA